MEQQIIGVLVFLVVYLSLRRDAGGCQRITEGISALRFFLILVAAVAVQLPGTAWIPGGHRIVFIFMPLLFAVIGYLTPEMGRHGRYTMQEKRDIRKKMLWLFLRHMILLTVNLVWIQMEAVSVGIFAAYGITAGELIIAHVLHEETGW